AARAYLPAWFADSSAMMYTGSPPPTRRPPMLITGAPALEVALTSASGRSAPDIQILLPQPPPRHRLPSGPGNRGLDPLETGGLECSHRERVVDLDHSHDLAKAGPVPEGMSGADTDERSTVALAATIRGEVDAHLRHRPRSLEPDLSPRLSGVVASDEEQRRRGGEVSAEPREVIAPQYRRGREGCPARDGIIRPFPEQAGIARCGRAQGDARPECVDHPRRTPPIDEGHRLGCHGGPAAGVAGEALNRLHDPRLGEVLPPAHIDRRPGTLDSARHRHLVIRDGGEQSREPRTADLPRRAAGGGQAEVRLAHLRRDIVTELAPAGALPDAVRRRANHAHLEPPLGEPLRGAIDTRQPRGPRPPAEGDENPR